MTIELRNRHDSVVRVNTYNNKSRRNQIIEAWRKQYPIEILKHTKVRLVGEVDTCSLEYPILEIDLEFD